MASADNTNNFTSMTNKIYTGSRSPDQAASLNEEPEEAFSFWVLDEIRSLVRHCLRRDDPAYRSEKHCVRFIRFIDDVDTGDNLIAFAAHRPGPCCERRDVVYEDIVLLPFFFAQGPAFPIFTLYEEHRLSLDYQNLSGSGPAPILLHELVHEVTANPAAKATFKYLAGLKNPRGLRIVIDVDMAAVSSDTAEDQAIVDQVRKRYGIARNVAFGAYGPHSAQALARMIHGAEASLRNADSYAFHLQETLVDFLTIALKPRTDFRVIWALRDLLNAEEEVKRQEARDGSRLPRQYFAKKMLELVSPRTHELFAHWQDLSEWLILRNHSLIEMRRQGIEHSEPDSFLRVEDLIADVPQMVS